MASTAAERRLARLLRDRPAELANLIKSISDDPSWPTALRSSLEAEGPGRTAFLDTGLADGLWVDVRNAMDTAIDGSRSMDQLLFHDLADDSVSAICGIENDGSGLVLVSDGLQGVVVHVAQRYRNLLLVAGCPRTNLSSRVSCLGNCR
jgi:hypothetical protein